MTFDCVVRSNDADRSSDSDEHCRANDTPSPFTVSHATSSPKKPTAPSADVVRDTPQSDYIPMDYDAELEACQDVVFSECAYYCTIPRSASTPAFTDSSSCYCTRTAAGTTRTEEEDDSVPYDYDEALYNDHVATHVCAGPEPHSPAWQEAQEALWGQSAEGRHYAWCQRMAGESCYSSGEQSQYALKTLLREACERDLKNLSAMPDAFFAPCGAVEERRLEVNRAASCTSLASMTAYMEAQQLRARYLDGELTSSASDAAARKRAYMESARTQWQHLADYVTRELAEDSLRLRSLTNTIQQLCLFRTGIVAPDLEVTFSCRTSARPNTPYSSLFGVARELDLTLVESQKRQRRQNAEMVLATLASHNTLFMPPTLRACEEQPPTPVLHDDMPPSPSNAGAVGEPTLSPVSGPTTHSPLFSLILDPSELELTQQLLLDEEEEEGALTSLDTTSHAAERYTSPWDISLPRSAPSAEIELSHSYRSHTDAAGSIGLRHTARSWCELNEIMRAPESPTMQVPNNGSATTNALNPSYDQCNANNTYALPSALFSRKDVSLSSVVLSPAACPGAGCRLTADTSPSRFSSFTEGHSSQGEMSYASENQPPSVTWAQLDAAVNVSPELIWLTPATQVEPDGTNAPRLSEELLQHHEQQSVLSDGESFKSHAPTRSFSSRTRTHQDIENICRGWLFDTTTRHYRSCSSESGATDSEADRLIFLAEMMDDEDARIDSEEAALVL